MAAGGAVMEASSCRDHRIGPTKSKLCLPAWNPQPATPQECRRTSTKHQRHVKLASSSLNQTSVGLCTAKSCVNVASGICSPTLAPVSTDTEVLFM